MTAPERERAAVSGGISPLRLLAVLGLALAAAAAALIFCVLFGPTSVDIQRVLTFDPTTPDYQKVFHHRLPRALAAMLVGGSLAVAGTGFQALIRNPLASPYILGVSAGGSLGAVLALAAGASLVTAPAFAGALLAVLTVYAVARTGGRVPSTTLLLAGVVVNAFFTAGIMLVNLMAAPDDQVRIVRWLVGGLRDDYRMSALLPAAGLALAVPLALFLLSRELNLISLGDVAAERAGVNVKRTRTWIFLLSSLATAVAVSIAGPIGFVGLIVPHVLRLLVGPDHRLLLPATLLGGGAFLAVIDSVGQSAFDQPLPAGVVTAFLGGPLFLVLLKRRDQARAGLHG